MPVAAHRRFVHTDFLAAFGNQRFQLPPHDRDERMRKREPVRISLVRVKTPTESVRTGHARLQIYASMSNTFQAPKLLHDAQAAWGPELSGHVMFPTLVVPRRPKPPLRQWFGGNTAQEPIKREIEIETGLFTVSDRVQSRVHLILDGHSHRIIQ